MAAPSLSELLEKGKFPKLASRKEHDERVERLQLRMLRIQQGLYHSKRRAIIALEGFDAAGKGGAIRRLTEHLDPRGAHVVPIGPPTPEEQGRHYLYRFWRELPAPGTITVFDRTWYGRVLVERVEGFAPKEAWRRAYKEINQFEKMLVDDGIDLVKIFLAISKPEQRERFEARLKDPYKQWKLGEADVRAREKWDDYVEAADEMFERTDKKRARWHLVPADHKWYARTRVLELATERLSHHGVWMESRARKREARQLEKDLAKLDRA